MKLEDALTKLNKDGYKTTTKRKDILVYFAETDGYRTPKDLIRYLELSYDAISFDTIYRNLHLFNDLGILESTELNGEKHFRISCTKHHHHHFICNTCGTTKEIEVCPMNDVENTLSNYQIQGHKFEIYGLCPECRTL